jgi:AcrR family transcriptional regulator
VYYAEGTHTARCNVPQKPTIERILETADRLFYGQGTVIGVDTIAAEAGISKRTLYNHFPSKDALIVAYLQRRLRPIAVSEAPPAQQILDDFDRLERAFGWEGFRGCAFVNAVAELKDPQHAANAVALEFKERRRQWFRALLEQGGAADPEGLSLQLLLLVDGAIAAALVRKDPTVARAAKAAARVLLQAAGVGARPSPASTEPSPIRPTERPDTRPPMMAPRFRSRFRRIVER